MDEIWKTVIINGVLHNDYMVSNKGRIKSLKRGKEKFMKLGNSHGYLNVMLDGKTYLVNDEDDTAPIKEDEVKEEKPKEETTSNFDFGALFGAN